ncbi:MAG: hypothetical protein ACLPN5_07170 [Roseiarcus sp.]
MKNWILIPSAAIMLTTAADAATQNLAKPGAYNMTATVLSASSATGCP